MLLLERVLVPGPQVHDARHVGLVEGGQDGGGLLGLDQPLGDPLADAAHPLAGLAGPRRRRRAGRAAPGRVPRGGAGASGAGVARCASTSSLVMPTASAGPLDLARGRRPPRRPAGGRRARARPPSPPLASARPRAARCRRLGGRGRRLRRSAVGRARRGRRPRPARGVDRADGRADGDRLALGDGDLAGRPAAGAGTTLLALSVSSSKSGSSAFTADAVGLQPARQDALGDRLADARHVDRNGGHLSLTPCRGSTGPRPDGPVASVHQVRDRRADGGLDQLRLLALVDRVRARRRAGAGVAADVLERRRPAARGAAARRTTRRPCSATPPAPRPTRGPCW